MKLYKLMFSLTLIMSTLISISSYSWMGMWMGLEINLLSIIPLMNSKKNSLSKESSLKYFIVQASMSTLILFSIIMISKIPFSSSAILMIMNGALLTKMGTAPFHFWFPEIIDGLSWPLTLCLMTWQKIAPMLILLNNLYSSKMIICFIVSSLMIGGIMGLNQVSLRKILTYSSINHIGWMLASVFLSMKIFWIYFIIYSLISTILIFLLNSLNLFSLNQIIISMKLNEMQKLSLLVNMMSMAGIPPFLGFFSKWMILNNLITKFPNLSITMIILTIISMFFYMRMIFSTLMMTSENNFLHNTPLKMNFFFLNFVNLLGLILMPVFLT